MYRQCEKLGIPEETDLRAGMDFRLPQYRREVFLRFYEFHTRYKAHPGAVYYAMPYIFDKFGMTMEEKLWFAYINGLSQNILTTFEIWSRFPVLRELDMKLFTEFFRDNYPKFGWDTDRRYVKNQLEKCVENYIKLLNGRTQLEYFRSLGPHDSQEKNFQCIWKEIMEKFYLFGRLSTFSYMEYLRIAGLNIDCDSLFLDDISGSKSHRNGLCKVLGRDDLDWHDSNPNFDGKYPPELIKWLELEGEKLLSEARSRFPEVTYFTLESTLCCYKSWFRKNRRYPNVYNDMFYDRIKVNETHWKKVNGLFRILRMECLPEYLRVEDNAGDPGLAPEKQNHFRETGEVIMMDQLWPCFKNSFNSSPKYTDTRNLMLF